jgi:hypothetical protein
MARLLELAACRRRHRGAKDPYGSVAPLAAGTHHMVLRSYLRFGAVFGALFFAASNGTAMSVSPIARKQPNTNNE